MEKVNVLLVDDHALFREGLRKVLSLEDDICIVGEAQSGEEALEKIGSILPDVVVMDISLPHMTGLEATSQILKDFPQVKVLTLSVYDSEEYVIEALRSGASGYLSKDVDGNMLIEAIRIIARGEAIVQPSILVKFINRLYHRDKRNGQALEIPKVISQLTEREREIVMYVANGNCNRTIAEKLYISEKTVKNHISSILKKLSLEDRTQLAIYAYRTGLVRISDDVSDRA